MNRIEHQGPRIPISRRLCRQHPGCILQSGNPLPSTAAGGANVLRLPRRGGFTLVEMLVSVTLVLLMMLMFAEIFELASSALQTSKGLAENDQRARSGATVIENDLKHRTYKRMVPFYPGEMNGYVDANRYAFSQRQGYFSISENDPLNDTDDVLQFTVGIPSDEAPLFGRAAPLTSTAEFTLNPNQPDADDGNINPDRTASSRFAEVCYFVRNGNLYRKVLLIREPLSIAGITSGTQPQKDLYLDTSSSPPQPMPYQPTAPDKKEFFFSNPSQTVTLYPDLSASPVNTGDFWNDFDLSAYAVIENGVLQARTHGVEDLDTGSGLGVSKLSTPRTRFGHNHATGQPREYLYSPGADGIIATSDDIPNAVFFGRYTSEELAHPNFNYPHYPSQNDANAGQPYYPGNPPDSTEFISGGNPMQPVGGLNQLHLIGGIPVSSLGASNAPGTAGVDDDGNGVIDDASEIGWPGSDDIAFRGLRRRSEDVVLTGVEAFDVEVYDDYLNRYVDIGHAGSSGAYSWAANNHLFPGDTTDPTTITPVVYGPRQPIASPLVTAVQAQLQNRVYDTWSPNNPLDGSSQDTNGDGIPDPAPYRPMRFSSVTRTPALDSYSGAPATPRVGFWQPGITPVARQVGPPPVLGTLVFPNPLDSASHPGPNPAIINNFDIRNSQKFVYECIDNSSNATTSGTEPDWSQAQTDGSTMTDSDGIRWRAIKNEPLPMRSIRITIRFRDVNSGQIRQVSIVRSLLGNED